MDRNVVTHQDTPPGSATGDLDVTDGDAEYDDPEQDSEYAEGEYDEDAGYDEHYGDYPPRWVPIAALLLCFFGLGVSIYLTIEHYTGNHSLSCPAGGGAINCLKVTTSSESMVFGIFPVAVLGLAFFVAFTAINVPPLWRTRDIRVAWLRLAMAITGIGMVIYLLSAELFSIGAICLWCTSVHVVTFILFVLVMSSFPSMLHRDDYYEEAEG
jgi:uncharacterized membrane protein